MDKGPRPAPPLQDCPAGCLLTSVHLRGVSRDRAVRDSRRFYPPGPQCLGSPPTGASLPPSPFLSSFQVLTLLSKISRGAKALSCGGEERCLRISGEILWTLGFRSGVAQRTPRERGQRRQGLAGGLAPWKDLKASQAGTSAHRAAGRHAAPPRSAPEAARRPTFMSRGVCPAHTHTRCLWACGTGLTTSPPDVRAALSAASWTKRTPSLL